MRKTIWLAIILVSILSVMFFTVSCAKKVAMQTQPEMTEPEVSTAADRSAEEAERARQLQEDRLRAETAAREAAGKAFSDENIHFAFNSSVLTDQAKRILSGKADYLRTNPSLTITVEGHCDARGTKAYNLTLGERRAESVKSYLVNMGISTHRLATISYGKKRPIAMGQNEESWAKNRRAQFVIN